MSPTPRVQSGHGPPKARSDAGQATEARQGRAASSSAEAAGLDNKGASGLRRGSSGSSDAQVVEPRRTRTRSTSAEVEGVAQLGPEVGHKRSGSAGTQATKPSSSKAGAKAQQQQQQQQEDVEEEDEGQLQELYSFAERFRLLLLEPDSLPPRQGSSRAVVLEYLRRYLGEAPQPQEGEKWGESMAQLFSWARGDEVYAYEAEECFSEAPDGGLVMNEQRLRALDLFPGLWTVPYTSEEVRNAQTTAIEAKAHAAATPKPAALVGQKQPQQQQAATAVAPSAAAGGAACNDAAHGAGISGPLEPCDKLRHRVLMHIATSLGAVEESELLERFEEEAEEDLDVRSKLKKLVAAGLVQQQEGGKKKKKYLATEDGKAALQASRERLLACARAERQDSSAVDEEWSLVGRKGKGRFYDDKRNEMWYKASVQDFDGWRHLVTYEDGDQIWQNLPQDLEDGDFVLEPEEEQQQQGRAAAAPAGLPKKRSAPSSPKAKAVPPKRKREGDGQQPAHAAAEGDAGAAAKNAMYAGEFDIDSAEGDGAQLEPERGPDHPPAKKQHTSARGRKAAAGERAGEAQAAAEPPGNTSPQGCTISLRSRKASEPEAAAQPAGQAREAAASQPAAAGAAEAQSAAMEAAGGAPEQRRQRKKTMTKAHMDRKPSKYADKLVSMVRDSEGVPAVDTSEPQARREPADQQPARGQNRERRQQQQQQQQRQKKEQQARPAIRTSGHRVKEEPVEQEPVSPRRLSPRHQQLPPPQEGHAAGIKRKAAAAAAVEPTGPEWPSSTAAPEPAAAGRAATRPRSGSRKAACGSQAAAPAAAAAGPDAAAPAAPDAGGVQAAGAAVPAEAPGAVRSSRRRSAPVNYKDDSEEEAGAAADGEEGLMRRPAPRAKQQRAQDKGGGALQGKSAGAAAAGRGGSSRATAEPAGPEQPGGAEAPEPVAPSGAGAAQSRRRAPGKAAQGQAVEAPVADGIAPEAVMASPGTLAVRRTGRQLSVVNYNQDSEAEAEEQRKQPHSRQKQQQAQKEDGAVPRRKPVRTAAAAAAAEEAGSRPGSAAANQGGAPEGHPGDHPGAAPLSKQDCYWWRDRTGEKAELVPYWRSGAGAKVVEREKNLPVDQKTTKSCHDCQGQHYIWLCKREGCVNTYCVRCTSRYDYLFEGGHEADLQKFCQGWCPCCIGICLRVKCLRNTLVQLGEPPAEAPVGRDQVTLLALHAAFQLVEPAMRIYQENKAEAQRQGTKLEDVPRVDIGIYNGKRMPGSERMLCNRCATTIENAHYHCANCQEDLCLACTAELQGQQPGPVPCATCGKFTKLQQFFRREQVQRLAASVQRLRRVYEAGPLGPLLQELYNPQQRLWYVEGEPLADREARLQQQQQQQPGGVGKAAQPQRGKKRQGLPLAAEGAAGIANGVAVAPADQGGTAPAAPAVPAVATAHAGRSESQEANSAQVSGEVGSSNGGVDGGKRQRKRTEKAAASVEQEALFKGGVAHAVSVVAGQQEHRQQQQQQQQQHSNGGAHGAALQRPPLAPEDAAFLEQHRLAVPGPSSPEMTRWWEREHLREWVTQDDLRLAAQRPGGVQNVIWTPHVSVFAEGNPHRGEAVRLFTERWLLGEPVVVRGFTGRMDWTPATMERVTRDMSNKSGAKVVDLHILDCSKFSPGTIKVLEFFKLYRQCSGTQQDPEGKALPMYKLKDWPVDATFAEKLGRHNDDFLGLLNSCVPVYTHPTSQATGVLNLANHLPWYALKPDLGPKGYIAYGREAEHEGEGDSVTKLHEDLSEAINIMCHVQLPPEMPAPKPRSGSEQMWDPQHYGYAGAVWDVFRREDRPVLERFLLDCVRGKRPDLPPFVHQGRRLTEADVYHVMHAQCFMLTERHRQALREEHGVHPWHFEQFGWEGVFVPGGTPHQVRNLRSCTKIALDFVTPEALGECMRLREDFRHLVASDPHREEDPGSYHYADRLQVRNMVLSGLEWALEKLEEREAQLPQQAGAPE